MLMTILSTGLICRPMIALTTGNTGGRLYLTGEVDHYNIICAPGSSNTNVSPRCVPSRFGGTGAYSEGTETIAKYDLKTPVFPVVNAIIGFQIKPADHMVINIEGGIRTLPFIGISAGYFFN